MQATKNRATPKPNQPINSMRVVHRGGITLLVAATAVSFLLGASGFQTCWSKERRLISAAGEIIAALSAYSCAAPGTAKDFPLELADLRHDPRMLADVSYPAILPVDPIAQTMEWGVIRNKSDQVIGVHSLSSETPTLFAKLFSFRGGEKYADWKFLVE
jgi:hypothetical protein